MGMYLQNCNCLTIHVCANEFAIINAVNGHMQGHKVVVLERTQPGSTNLGVLQLCSLIIVPLDFHSRVRSEPNHCANPTRFEDMLHNIADSKSILPLRLPSPHLNLPVEPQYLSFLV